MKLSKIFLRAAERIGDGDSNIPNYAIGKEVGYGREWVQATNFLHDLYLQDFRWDNGAGDQHEASRIALCFAAIIADDEGR